MVTLATASRPIQSQWSPLSPPIPEQPWQEPPPPFLRITSTQNHNLSKNSGPSTLLHVTAYSPQANTNNAPIALTMDPSSFTPHSTTAKGFNFLGFVIRCWHSGKATNITKSNPKDIIILELMQIISK